MGKSPRMRIAADLAETTARVIADAEAISHFRCIPEGHL